jgi:uncharacterized membrane protein YfcA
VLIGVLTGLAGSVTGVASLVSYPALLAVGLTPVAANVTNTVALLGVGVGAALGSGPELRGRRRELAELVVCGALGGAAGATLLLLAPAGVFERLVPWLIGSAALTVLLPRRPPGPAAPALTGTGTPSEIGTGGAPGTTPAGRTASWSLNAPTALAIVAVSVYGGYFGAAAGVLLLALLLRVTHDTLAHASATRNVVLFAANLIAAVGFALFGPVDWLVCLPMAIGCLAGGRAGPVILRRAPAGPLRAVIAVIGLVMAAWLGVGAYT